MKKYALIGVLALSSVPFAQVFDTTAIDNATVQPGGPRTGTNGKRFFNVQGNDNGNFASFGVIDFNGGAFGFPDDVIGINGATLSLYHAPAGFSASGPVNFWISEDVSANIQPGSTLAWDSSSLPNGVGSQLAPVHFLGSGSYTSTEPNEFLFVYDLTFDATAAAYLINQLNTNGLVRMVVTPGANNVSATWSGYTNTITGGASAAPILTLDVDVVPEPATLGLLAGGLGLLAARCRRR